MADLSINYVRYFTRQTLDLVLKKFNWVSTGLLISILTSKTSQGQGTVEGSTMWYTVRKVRKSNQKSYQKHCRIVPDHRGVSSIMHKQKQNHVSPLEGAPCQNSVRKQVINYCPKNAHPRWCRGFWISLWQWNKGVEHG